MCRTNTIKTMLINVWKIPGFKSIKKTNVSTWGSCWLRSFIEDIWHILLTCLFLYYFITQSIILQAVRLLEWNDLATKLLYSSLYTSLITFSLLLTNPSTSSWSIRADLAGVFYSAGQLKHKHGTFSNTCLQKCFSQNEQLWNINDNNTIDRMTHLYL